VRSVLGRPNGILAVSGPSGNRSGRLCVNSQTSARRNREEVLSSTSLNQT
jgi:hypothetical protein